MRRLLPAALLPIRSRFYFSFQCISFQMREASGFPLTPIGCKPWQNTVLGFSARNIVFLASACPDSSDRVRNIFIHFYYNMAKFLLSTGQLSHRRNFFIFTNFLLSQFLLSAFLFYNYSTFLACFRFYLEFALSYLCYILLIVLNFSFLLCFLWIFAPFYFFYNFYALLRHNILTFANCKLPFSMIHYMLY